MNTEQKADRIKVTSKISNVDLEVKNVVEDWILLTYDIPATKEGNEARYQFLRDAKRMGAVQHTKSVWLLPWTKKAELAALEIAKIGDALLWISKPKDSEAVTKVYDTAISERISELKRRQEKAEELEKDQKSGMAERVRRKNKRLFQELIEIVVQRSSGDLREQLSELEQNITGE